MKREKGGVVGGGFVENGTQAAVTDNPQTVYSDGKLDKGMSGFGDSEVRSWIRDGRAERADRTAGEATGDGWGRSRPDADNTRCLPRLWDETASTTFHIRIFRRES